MLALAFDDRDPPSPPRDAEEIAVMALAYIAWRKTELDDFLHVTGLSAETVLTAAKTPQFLTGVLDYVMSERDVLDRVCRDLRIQVEAVAKARLDLLPRASLTPVAFGPGPLALRCEHCGQERAISRRAYAVVPDRVATIVVARCGPCGGSVGGPEGWLDAEGRSALPY